MTGHAHSHHGRTVSSAGGRRSRPLDAYQLRSRSSRSIETSTCDDATNSPQRRGDAAWLWSRRQVSFWAVSRRAVTGRSAWMPAGQPHCSGAIGDASSESALGQIDFSTTSSDGEWCARDHTCPHRTRHRLSLPRREGCRRSRRFGPRNPPEDGRCRTARRAVCRAREASARPARQSTSSTQERTSPRETWLRLLLIRAGFPGRQTQIPVYDEYGVLIAVIDVGWEDIKVGADYEGDHHRMSHPVQQRHPCRAEGVANQGWIDVRVTVEDCDADIIRRVAEARARRA